MINADWSNLNDKQKATIEEYIKTGNKTASYRKVYDTGNMTKKTINGNCYRFFTTPKIKRIIDKIHEEALRRANIRFQDIVNEKATALLKDDLEEEEIVIDAQWVLKRASMLADFNIRKFINVNESGEPVYDFSDADDDDWYCIQECTNEIVERGQTYSVNKIKIKGYDKLRALELVGKHVEVQAFRNQIGVGNPDGSSFDDLSDDELDRQLDAKLKDLLNDSAAPESNE